MLKSTEKANIFKDENTGALINRDTGELQAYKIRKEQARKAANLEKRVQTLEKQMEETLNLLRKILNNQNG